MSEQQARQEKDALGDRRGISACSYGGEKNPLGLAGCSWRGFGCKSGVPHSTAWLQWGGQWGPVVAGWDPEPCTSQVRQAEGPRRQDMVPSPAKGGESWLFLPGLDHT